MKKLLDPIGHYFMEGVKRIEIEPRLLSLELDESQKKGIKEWEKFVRSRSGRLPAREKVALATRMPWKEESGTLMLSAFPVEYKYVIAAVDSPVQYYGHKKPPKVEGLDLYALSVSGINRVTGYPGILLGSRPEVKDFDRLEERIDTVPSAVLEKGDKKQYNPFSHRFVQEAGKNSVQPDSFSIRKYGVIRSEGWNNLIQCFEAFTPIDRIERDYEMHKTEWGLRLERKGSKRASKYSYLFICPEERLMDYAVRIRGKLSDRTRCILKEYLGRSGR
jgi:hypothetical protein